MPGRRFRALVAVAGLCTAALAGCAITGSTPAEALSAAFGDESQNAGDPPAEGDAEATCTADDFAVKIAVPPQHRESGVVTVTNTSAGHCDVDGWTGLTVLDSDEQPVQVPFKQVTRPGPGTNIDLAPGASAYAGVRFDLGSVEDDDAYEVAQLVAIPAGTNNSVPARLVGVAPENLVISSIEMGTLQRSEEATRSF